MKKNLGITKPRHSEQIVPVPWPIITSRFHCSLKYVCFLPIQYNVEITMSQGTNKICSLSQGFFISKFFSIHFTVEP